MSDPDRLPTTVLSLVREQPHEIGFSSVSAWELAIKSSLGKVSGIPFGVLGAEIEALGWNELGFSVRHASAVAGLPFHHHDPFDRALIAQCLVENLTFVTVARVAPLYPVKVLWQSAAPG